MLLTDEMNGRPQTFPDPFTTQSQSLFLGEDLLSLGMRADEVRRRLHPEKVVTYMNSATVVSGAALSDEAAVMAIEQALELGSRAVLLSFKRDATPSLATCKTLLSGLRARFPSLWFEALTSAEVLAIADRERLGAGELLLQLQCAGLNGLASEEDIGSPSDWLGVQRIAHGVGLRTTAVLPVSPGTTYDQRLRWLEDLYHLQEETGGFRSLSVSAPAFGGQYLSEELTAVEFLTAVATARLSLPNVPHVESSWRAQGLKVLQLTLRFGADDAGSTLLHETLNRPGPDTPTEEDLRRIIRDAGFSPVERSADYTSCYLP